VDALTIACIEHAEAIMRRLHPRIAHLFDVTQGSYQAGAGDPNSAGTHDKGGVVDLHWCGHAECVWALRKAGMFASHRTPDQGPWVDHVHAVVVGHPLLATGARAQVWDYLAGKNGLATHAADDGPRINPIPRPVWPWPRKDWFDMATESDLRSIVADEVAKATPAIIEALLDAQVDDDPQTTVRRALRRASESKGA
jgi:hypothetical protein